MPDEPQLDPGSPHMDDDDYRHMGIPEASPVQGEPNDTLAEEVRRRLDAHQRIDVSSVQMEVRGDTVILSGTVQDRHARGRAEELALEVEGVGSVVNRLVVQRGESAGPTLSIREPGSSDDPSTQRS